MTSRMNKYNASLLELADEQYKCFHSKICPDIPADRIIGVQIPKITEKVFASMRLDPQVQNKAIQKIRDSRRVSRADKDYLLKYKI